MSFSETERADAEISAGEKVACELRDYAERWTNAERGIEIEAVWAGHPLHSAVVALEVFMPERGPKRRQPLWFPAVYCWRNFLLASREGRSTVVHWATAMECAVDARYCGESETRAEEAIEYARKADEDYVLRAISKDLERIREIVNGQEERRLAAMPRADGNDEVRSDGR